jgi:hypothetical protein
MFARNHRNVIALTTGAILTISMPLTGMAPASAAATSPTALTRPATSAGYVTVSDQATAAASAAAVGQGTVALLAAFPHPALSLVTVGLHHAASRCAHKARWARRRHATRRCACRAARPAIHLTVISAESLPIVPVAHRQVAARRPCRARRAHELAARAAHHRSARRGHRRLRPTCACRAHRRVHHAPPLHLTVVAPPVVRCHHAHAARRAHVVRRVHQVRRVHVVRTLAVHRCHRPAQVRRLVVRTLAVHRCHRPAQVRRLVSSVASHRCHRAAARVQLASAHRTGWARAWAHPLGHHHHCGHWA